MKLFKNPAGMIIATPIKKVFKTMPDGSGNRSDLTIYMSIARGTPTVKASVKSNIKFNSAYTSLRLKLWK